MIGWLMDRLADRVNHGYWYEPDPNSIQNNHYGQWGQAKDNNMAINPPYSLPTNAISSLNSQNVTQWPQPGTCGIGISQAQSGVLSYTGGTIVTICFTDAKGQNWALDVDPRHAQTLLQISQAHQANAQYAYAASVSATQVYNKPQASPPIMVKPASMIEGDFTEGEMELAENIIAELEGGEKGSKQNIQADIDCEA